MKIQIKIALLFSIFTASFIAILSMSVYYLASKNSFDDFYKRLEIRAVIAAKAALETNNTHTRAYEDIREKHLQKLPAEEEYFFRLNRNNQYEEVNNLLPLPGDFYATVIASKYGTYRDQHKFYTGILYTGNAGNYIVIVSANNEYSIEYLKNLKNTLLTGFFISVMIAFTIGLLFSWQIFKPVRSIISKVKEISTKNLHLRLENNNSKDEIGELSGTFNNMLDRLETSFETQKNFISNASHELSTPLTAIIGEAELSLRKERTEEAYRESIQVILSEANRLNLITKNLLNLAQTGFGKKESDREKVRIDELLYEIIHTIHKTHEGSNIIIDQSLLPEDEAMLTTDGNRQLLHLAFSNIIMNACKYSDNKPVVVALGATDTKLVIAVKDTGIGIPDSELKYIYDPFFRASNTGNYQGYGIGLPLARNIIRLHKGELFVTAEEGKGTHVQIHIPFASI